MLEAFALRLAAMLFHMARQETDILLGVPGEISKLQRMFSDLSRILIDAERNHICNGNATVGSWVSELRDAMYDMDNVLDKWQILQWGKGPSTSSMLRVLQNLSAILSLQPWWYIQNWKEDPST